eukprot:1197561-Alexandrium_andersonii.AAC.1
MAYPVLPRTDSLAGIVKNDAVKVAPRLFQSRDVGEATLVSVSKDSSPARHGSKPCSSAGRAPWASTRLEAAGAPDELARSGLARRETTAS